MIEQKIVYKWLSIYLNISNEQIECEIHNKFYIFFLFGREISLLKCCY